MPVVFCNQEEIAGLVCDAADKPIETNIRNEKNLFIEKNSNGLMINTIDDKLDLLLRFNIKNKFWIGITGIEQEIFVGKGQQKCR